MRSSYLRFRLLLSNISDKMAFRIRKEKENRPKKNAKNAELFGGSSKSPIVSDEKTLQCHAPIVGCICKGEPIPASISEGGIKMRCTNEKCIYARSLIHPECFDMLEKHLIKIISNIGSARGWTDNQRKHNLWEKKGLTLVQKLLRCKCDRGQMVRDTDFYKETREPKANAENKTNAEEGNKLKKKKKKELPRLNFGYNSTVIPPSENSDLYKKKFNELESHFLSSHVDDDDLSSLNSSDVTHPAGILNNCGNHQKGAWRKTPSLASSVENGGKQRTLSGATNQSTQRGVSSPTACKEQRKTLTQATPPPTTTAWKTVSSGDVRNLSALRHFLLHEDVENKTILRHDALTLDGRSSATNALASSNCSLSCICDGNRLSQLHQHHPDCYLASPVTDATSDAFGAPFSEYCGSGGELLDGSGGELLDGSGGELLETNKFDALSPSVQRITSSTTYTLFGRTMSFFLGERILAELYLPSGAFS